MKEPSSTAVLHVALDPVTGPLSMMRNLATAQHDAGHYRGVGVGVIASGDWLTLHKTQLSGGGLAFYSSPTPKLFGTASFLLQRIIRPPIASWANHLAKSTGAEEVIIHYHNAWLSGAFLPLRGLELPAINVATFHGFAGQGALLKQPLRLSLHRLLARQLIEAHATLTSVDGANLQAFESILGLPAENFEVIPNGMPAQPRQTRPFLNGASKLTVAQIGALTPGKGWHISADAVIQLAASGHAIQLLIAGEGPDIEAVKSVAARHSDCITYLGRVEDPVRALLPKVDVLTLPTSNDGLPMVILEAMCSGIPVISTRIGGIPEAIISGRNGYLISPTVDECSLALKTIHDSRELLATLSNSAREDFLRGYEISTVVDLYHRLYQKILGHGPEIAAV
jgi:glycosyltransferase involved in cell wall biosynthesis